MNAEIKALWLEKLRDPETKQTRGALNRTIQDDRGGLCCLGVLCELAADAGVVERAYRMGVDQVGYRTVRYPKSGAVDVEYGVLPREVQEWAGLDSPNPKVEVRGQGVLLLSTENDKGRTFAEIADMIEVGL